MKIVPARDGDHPTAAVTTTFTGDVFRDPVLDGDDVGIANVFFAPGGRTYWHRHDRGQVLVVLQGSGWLQVRGGAGGAIRAGDVAFIDPDEEHWHGATPETMMLHLAISLAGHEWLDEVSDADYHAVFGGRND